jgi:hypothetical protein
MAKVILNRGFLWHYFAVGFSQRQASGYERKFLSFKNNRIFVLTK